MRNDSHSDYKAVAGQACGMCVNGSYRLGRQGCRLSGISRKGHPCFFSSRAAGPNYLALVIICTIRAWVAERQQAVPLAWLASVPVAATAEAEG